MGTVACRDTSVNVTDGLFARTSVSLSPNHSANGRPFSPPKGERVDDRDQYSLAFALVRTHQTVNGRRQLGDSSEWYGHF